MTPTLWRRVVGDQHRHVAEKVLQHLLHIVMGLLVAGRKASDPDAHAVALDELHPQLQGLLLHHPLEPDDIAKATTGEGVAGLGELLIVRALLLEGVQHDGTPLLIVEQVDQPVPCRELGALEPNADLHAKLIRLGEDQRIAVERQPADRGDLAVCDGLVDDVDRSRPVPRGVGQPQQHVGHARHVVADQVLQLLGLFNLGLIVLVLGDDVPLQQCDGHLPLQQRAHDVRVVPHHALQRPVLAEGNVGVQQHARDKLDVASLDLGDRVVQAWRRVGADVVQVRR